MTKILDGARTALEVCMGARKGETVLIITDTEKLDIGEALFQIAQEMQTEALLTVMTPRTRHGEEPPKSIAEMMRHSQVVLAPTAYSLTHTQARKRANRSGARIATMPGITSKMMTSGGMTADFKDIAKGVKRLQKRLRGVEEAVLTSKAGSDITFGLEGREWIGDTGICHKRGQFINLPAGEVFIAPKEGTTEGTLVVDGAFWEVLEKPVTVTVKKGFAKKFVNGRKIEKILDEVGKKGRNVAELGIGMNPKAKIIGNVLEDEKVMGTVHVAFGDNSTFGGRTKAGVHMDGIIKDPTLEVDGKVVLEEGKLPD